MNLARTVVCKRLLTDASNWYNTSMTDLEKKLWLRAKRYVKILRVVPFVRMVAVCNNLAFGKVDEQSDIDLFVIAKNGRLFTVRILVTLILHFLAVRRHGGRIAGRFCLSFFVDDSGLDLSAIAIERDIYLAYWLKTMVPLIDDGVSDELLVKNRWASRYLENRDDFFIVKKGAICSGILYDILRKILDGKFGNWFENKMKCWQLERAGDKAKKAPDGADIVVDEHVLKFHNIDRRKEYRDRWFGKYGEGALITKEKFDSL